MTIASMDSTDTMVLLIIRMKMVKCVIPENIHTSNTEGTGNSEGVGGQRPRKFQRGRGLDEKNHFSRV